MPSHLSLNTTASFVTNTNWQYYGGEYTMSYLTPDGRARGAELRLGRGRDRRARRRSSAASRAARRATLGNFWVDLYRSLVYILLPLAIVVAVDPDLAGRAADLPRPRDRDDARRARTQTIARGPVASQIAIKQLGTNGGGFYNSNSAVPFENPNGLSNFLEMLAILLIPAAQVFMFGRMVLARRHAWAVFAAMFAVFAIGVAITCRRAARLAGAAQLRREHHAAARPERRQHVRQGGPLRACANTAIWTVATSDASNGSVNGGLDALTPAGGAVPLVNLFLGEVIFGGVGSGLYGMFFYIVIAVFVAGLMVGRTPEWLGKKIEAREIKYAARRRALRADDGARPDRDLDRRPSPGSRRSSTPASTASPRRSTPTTRSRTTTAAPSPATG